VSFRLRNPEHSTLAVLLKGAIGSPWPAWQAVGTGALAIEDPNETVDGVPLLGLLASGMNAWAGLQAMEVSPELRWSGDPLPLSQAGPWPAFPKLPRISMETGEKYHPHSFYPAEALFAVLLAAGANPWVAWKSHKSCDGEMDGFDLVVSWGCAALVDACLRHPMRPSLRELHQRSAWRAIPRDDRAQSHAHAAWLSGAETLVQLSAMCGNAQTLKLLLEHEFPLVRSDHHRHPFALAKTAEVCEVLFNHGVALKNATHRNQSLQEQWDLLANASVGHARTLKERRERLEDQLRVVEANRSPEEWLKYALGSFRRGSLGEMKRGLAAIAPGLGSEILDPDRDVSARAAGQVLERLSLSGDKQPLVVLADIMMGLKWTGGESKRERLHYGFVAMEAAVEQQRLKTLEGKPTSDVSWAECGKLLWRALGLKGIPQGFNAHTAWREFGRFWTDAPFDLKAGLDGLLGWAGHLSSSKQSQIINCWGNEANKGLQGRSIFVVKDALAHLQSHRDAIQRLGASSVLLQPFYGVLKEEPLEERIRWAATFCHGALSDDGFSELLSLAGQELVEVPTPWEPGLAQAVHDFRQEARNNTETPHVWERILMVWDRCWRANELSMALPAAAPGRSGPRF